MARAIVTEPFRGAPDGQIHPRIFEIGEKIDGDLATVAIQQGWAKPDDGLPVDEPPPAQAAGEPELERAHRPRRGAKAAP